MLAARVRSASPAGIVDAALTSVDKGSLRILVENKTAEAIRLLDAREGSAMCAVMWSVEIVLQDGHKLAPAMFYSPGDPPYLVTIEPGKTYERLIQPAAYVQFPQKREGRATVAVRYDVKEKYRNWKGITPRNLEFATPPLQMDLSRLL